MFKEFDYSTSIILTLSALITFVPLVSFFANNRRNGYQRVQQNLLCNTSMDLLTNGWFLIVDSSQKESNSYVNHLCRKIQGYFDLKSILLNVMDVNIPQDNFKIENWNLKGKNTELPRWYNIFTEKSWLIRDNLIISKLSLQDLSKFVLYNIHRHDQNVKADVEAEVETQAEAEPEPETQTQIVVNWDELSFDQRHNAQQQ